DDPGSPPSSPLSPHLFATYQKMIAEADLTKRERALVTVPPYGTEVRKSFMSVAVTSRGETSLTVQVCEDAKIRARDTQEEAQDKRLEALENVVQQICRNNY
nr:hypothetical protein [Tanacetum cinerariifolium]